MTLLDDIKKRVEAATPTGHIHEKECDLRACAECWNANRGRWELANSTPSDLRYLLGIADLAREVIKQVRLVPSKHKHLLLDMKVDELDAMCAAIEGRE